MVTKDQASVVADQLMAAATKRASQETLARLESRAGPMPPGITPGQFKVLIAEAESSVTRSWQFLIALVAWGVLLAGYLVGLMYFRVTPAIGAFPVVGLFALRQMNRRLVTRYIRHKVQGYA